MSSKVSRTSYQSWKVETKEKNSTSLKSFDFTLDDEIPLPEPVITVQTAYKKEVFTPGDPMTIKCSILPNSDFLNIDMELTVGERAVSRKGVTSVTLYTIANEDVDTAKCRVYVRKSDEDEVSRSSYRSWKVKNSLNDEYLRRRKEEVEADNEFMSFRKL